MMRVFSRSVGQFVAVVALLAMNFLALACTPPTTAQLHGGEHIDDVSIEGFPAISEIGDQVAILTTTHPLNSNYYLDIRSTASNNTLRKFVLVPSESVGTPASVEAAIAEANAYLRDKSFVPMEAFFSVPLSSQLPRPLPRAFEHTYEGLLVSVNLESYELTISSEESTKPLYRLKPKIQSLGGPSKACGNGMVGGAPSAGWIDGSASVAAIQVGYSYTADGCEAPDLWHVVRLGAAK